MRCAIPAIAALALLSGCHRKPPEPQQRVELNDTPPSLVETPLASPDTSKAVWIRDRSGKAIDFRNPGDKPMLTLACLPGKDGPLIAIIRHVPSRPGETALFPVIGNGEKARFKVQASLRHGHWLWEGKVPANDPQTNVFTGSHALRATLPGGGTLEIGGSRIPRQFLESCRAEPGRS